MEKDKTIILYTALLGKIEQQQNKIIDLKKAEEAIRAIKAITQKNKTIEIWGATTSKKHKENEVLTVNDHQNFTGSNPLIGNQNKTKEKFPDMSSLYKQTKKGIITTTRGKFFLIKGEYEYPTQYFCYFGIIARALGIKTIRGYLINKDIKTLKKHILAKNKQR